MKKLKYTTALATTLLLSGCASNQVAPQPNPNPKYFLTVKGHIDPKLQKDLTMNWAVDYYTTNKQCDYFSSFYNRLAGAPEGRTKTINYPVKTDKQGNYRINIPLNHYLPGFCQWQAGEIYYQYTYKKFRETGDGLTTIAISNQGKKVKNPVNQTRICKTTSTSCKLTPSSTLNINDDISTKFSTTAIVNFDYQGDKP